MRFRDAMTLALYGESGFWAKEWPSTHFHTSSAIPLFARAVVELITRVDEMLGHPANVDFVDVGAGEGDLVARVSSFAPAELMQRLRITAVELRPRPAHLPDEIVWTDTIPRVHGLLFANEWLDNVPLDIAVIDPSGTPQYLEIDRESGDETLGTPLATADAQWMRQWWPSMIPGARIELGTARDAVWREALSRVDSGAAVTIDYGHEKKHRRPTLASYRAGRHIPPVMDGSADVTAHVAMDSLAAVSEEAGFSTSLVRQREALRRLDITTTEMPSRELARNAPREYVAALNAVGEASELSEEGGLGDFWWLCALRQRISQHPV